MEPRGRKRNLAASTILGLRLLFGEPQLASASSNSKTFQSGGNSKTEISQVLEQKSPSMNDFNQKGSVQPEQVLKGTQEAQTALKIPYAGSDNTSSQPSKFSGGSKARGAARRDFARRQAGKNSPIRQSGGGFVADAFTVEPKFPARPGGNGLFGRFTPEPTPDPHNSGCAGGPRSITVLSQSKSSEQDSTREITAHDGLKAILTDKSANHLMSKHGEVLGIDDPLPPEPNQKPGKYGKIRTWINNQNKKQFTDTLEKILEDPDTSVFPDVSMRGIKGHGYYTENYGESGFFVGIHTEAEFAGQIKKAQPVTPEQLEYLRTLNSIN